MLTAEPRQQRSSRRRKKSYSLRGGPDPGDFGRQLANGAHFIQIYRFNRHRACVLKMSFSSIKFRMTDLGKTLTTLFRLQCDAYAEI